MQVFAVVLVISQFVQTGQGGCTSSDVHTGCRQPTDYRYEQVFQIREGFQPMSQCDGVEDQAFETCLRSIQQRGLYECNIKLQKKEPAPAGYKYSCLVVNFD